MEKTIMDDCPVKIGVKGHQETFVKDGNMAMDIGSGLVPVFATAMMIALMERAATLSIQPFLPEGQGSVGTHIDVSHCSATPPGMKVWADSEVIATDRRRITFSVKAYDERGLIGEGVHERFLIEVDRFLKKTGEKSSGEGRVCTGATSKVNADNTSSKILQI